MVTAVTVPGMQALLPTVIEAGELARSYFRNVTAERKAGGCRDPGFCRGDLDDEAGQLRIRSRELQLEDGWLKDTEHRPQAAAPFVHGRPARGYIDGEPHRDGRARQPAQLPLQDAAPVGGREAALEAKPDVLCQRPARRDGRGGGLGGFDLQEGTSQARRILCGSVGREEEQDTGRHQVPPEDDARHAQ